MFKAATPPALLCKAVVELAPLLTRCELVAAAPYRVTGEAVGRQAGRGRSATNMPNGHIKVSLRLRTPLESPQIQKVTRKRIVIRDYPARVHPDGQAVAPTTVSGMVSGGPGGTNDAVSSSVAGAGLRVANAVRPEKPGATMGEEAKREYRLPKKDPNTAPPQSTSTSTLLRKQQSFSWEEINEPHDVSDMASFDVCNDELLRCTAALKTFADAGKEPSEEVRVMKL